MMVKRKKSKAKKDNKESEISIKKFVSSPKIRYSGKKNKKGKGSYLQSDEYMDFKTKRTAPDYNK